MISSKFVRIVAARFMAALFLGRAAVLGVELVINTKQAAVVERIFAMCAEGLVRGVSQND
jgi:hypothetical protein